MNSLARDTHLDERDEQRDLIELQCVMIGLQLRENCALTALAVDDSKMFEPGLARIQSEISKDQARGIRPYPETIAAQLVGEEIGIDDVPKFLRDWALAAPAVLSADEAQQVLDRNFKLWRATVAKLERDACLHQADEMLREHGVKVLGDVQALLAPIERRAAGIFPFKASSLAGKDVPPRCELVERLLPLGKVAILAGDGGTGKSLLALQLAVAIQLGTCWVGQAIFERGPVLYLTAEDDSDEIHRRLAAIVATENVSFDYLAHLHVMSLVGEDAHLAVLNEQNAITATPLFHQLEAWTAQHKPVLIVLDTLSDLFGGNENDRTHAKAFVNLLAGLGTRHGATVLLLSHPSLSGMAKGNGLSGSTGWTGGPRSRLYLARITNQDGSEDDADIRVLRHNKANYGPAGTEVRLRWQQGVFVVDRPSDGVTTITAHAKGERVFIELVKAYTAEGRTVNANGGPNYAPTVFANDTPRNEGLTKRALADAMNRLLAAGKIRNERHGPASRSTTRLVIA